MKKDYRVKHYEEAIRKQEKIYEEARSAFPMALDPAFCKRIMDQSQAVIAQHRAALASLKRAIRGEKA